MGEANEGRTSALLEQCSLKLGKCPRNLLQKFISGDPYRSPTEEEALGIELNLGLSMGGKFGVDKNQLMRSSSIAACSMTTRPDSGDNLGCPKSPPVTRTSSLPVETEWRKRKELQTLRRLAAKRRRSQKQKNSRPSEKEAVAAAAAAEEEKTEILTNMLAKVSTPTKLVPDTKEKACNLQQGSAESLGGSSSGMSESESKGVQGSSSCSEAMSFCYNQQLQEMSYQEASGTKNYGSSSIVREEIPSKKPGRVYNRLKEIGKKALEDMPCVFTKGDGPNGRRIEGILYKYGKGQEVRIMCVCHGSFLSPAEFVQHAGGSDVAHPLRHIVVNPSTPSFL